MNDRITNFLHENVNLKNNKQKLIMLNLSEESKIDISDKLVTALYRNALNKSAFVNYGDIPDTKGDITRLKEYNTLIKSLENLEEINKSFKVENLDTILETLRIITAYKREFCLGFMQNKSIPILIYNNMVMSIICGTSACIVSCVDYLRTPDTTVTDELNKNRKNNAQIDLLFKNMEEFNISASKGDLKKMFESSLDKENFVGSISVGTGVLIGVGVLGAAIAIIPLTRELIYFFYNLRMKIADFFEIQAYFLKINVAELKAADKPRKDVIKKQEQRIKTLLKLANKFEVDFATSNVKANKELTKKIDATDLETNMGNQFTLI